MLVLVTYDVATGGLGGQRRLRAVAKACRDFGQRVEYSVFEIEVDPANWTVLMARLERNHQSETPKETVSYWRKLAEGGGFEVYCRGRLQPRKL
jgi:CRISPR-associated protein Cas2